MATSTPWGMSQTARALAPGIMLYTTASHGGIHLSPARMAELPARFHKPHTGYCPSDWFEEDCEAAFVIAGFPQYFTGEQVRIARQTIGLYYPDRPGAMHADGCHNLCTDSDRYGEPCDCENGTKDRLFQ